MEIRLDSCGEKIDRFKSLKELDEQICNQGYSLLKYLLLLGKIGCSKNQPSFPKNIVLAGSASEGSAIARIFKQNNEFDGGLNRELEVDVELFILDIDPKLRHIVEDIPGKTGYIKFCASPEVLLFANNVNLDGSKKYVEEYLTKISADGLGHPYNVKNFSLEKIKLRDKRNILEIAFAALYDEKISDIFVLKTEKVTNASVGSEFTVLIKNKKVLKLSHDLVTLIRIPWWPDVASEWKERKRNWPNDQRTMNDLTQTCCIIAKPSVAEKDNKETLDWRYSFSDVERKLFSLYNPQQKLIYFIFKAMFYKWLKPISPTQLSSFIGKNVMLKAAEDFPPQDEMWNESYDAIKTVLAYLFVQVQMAFENGCLPYYFINKINVIETIDLEVKKEVIEKIQWILCNIEERIPSNVSDVILFAEDVMQKLKSFDRIASNLLEKNYSDILNVNFLESNLDFFDKIALNLLKEAMEKKKIAERISKEVTRIKSVVHAEGLGEENNLYKKLKHFADKLALVLANTDPGIQNINHEALRVEAQAIINEKQVAERVEESL